MVKRSERCMANLRHKETRYRPFTSLQTPHREAALGLAPGNEPAAFPGPTQTRSSPNRERRGRGMLCRFRRARHRYRVGLGAWPAAYAAARYLKDQPTE